MAQDITDATGVIELDEEKHPFLSRVLNGKGLADVYQFGMSIQDSAAIVGLAAINPALGKVGTVLLSSSAGTQTMLDAVDRGATDEQALQLGILSGAFELLFETYELDTLLNADDVMWRNITNQALTEAFGESATEISNMAADYLIMGKNSNYEQNIVRYLAENPTWNYEQAAKQAMIDSALQVAEAGFGGLISGGAMGGGMSIVQNISQQANSVNQEDVAKSLRSKGIPTQKVDPLAGAIAARVNGQQLTRTQKYILNSALNNAAVRDTISDIIQKKSNGIDSTQHNGYDEISTIEGNAVTEGSALHPDQNAPSEGSYEGNSKTIINSTPELEAHIKNVDPSVPRKRGIGGAHNSQEFFKNDVEIVNDTPSKIPGVRTVEYRMPKLNADGTPTGEYGARVFKKTIYDPDVISDNDFMKRGLEAANDAISKADNGVMPREWSGVDSEGITWHGYYTYGEITSFFPDE